MAKSKRRKISPISYTQSSDEDSDYLDATMENRVAKPVSKSYTYAELCEYLKSDCGDEFKFMPNIDTLAFESWAGSYDNLALKPVVDKRLQFGETRSPRPHLNDKVYVYIGDEQNNRIGLVAGRDGAAIELGQAALVEARKPFWYLFSHGRALDNAEKKRLRALTCFFFLAGGHVETIGDYPGFLEHLSDAVVWYGTGLEVESREHTATASSNDSAIDTETVPNDNYRQNQAQSAGGGMAQDDAQVPQPPVQESQTESTEQRAFSTSSLNDLGNKVQEYLGLATKAAIAYQTEGRLITRKIDHYATLEHQLAERTQELKGMQLQIKEKDERNMAAGLRTFALRRELEKLVLESRTATNHWKSQAYLNEAGRDAEKTKRIAAEKKLEEIVQAHKKITDIIGGAQK